MKRNPILLILVGPTAVGKTALSIRLAKRFDTEIVSADSRQVFKETKLGTAKPTPDELRRFKHHFIDSHSIHDEFDAGKFAKEAEAVISSILKIHNVAIMVGGSGLYIKAFCEGLDAMPEINPQLRETLNDMVLSGGLEKLLLELREKDPEYYAIVDKKNPQRVIRALEVIRSTGLSYSSFRKKSNAKKHDFKIIKVGLDMDREMLYQRIDQRMDLMIKSGLFEEAETLYTHRSLNALQTVGYQEIFGFLAGKYNRNEAIRLLKRNSRRYAKRQITWFKRDADVKWFSSEDHVAIIRYITSLI